MELTTEKAERVVIHLAGLTPHTIVEYSNIDRRKTSTNAVGENSSSSNRAEGREAAIVETG